MLYKGKDYSDNEILEILNNKDNDILTYKEKLDGAEAKIKTFESDISTKDNTINELKIKNYDLLTKVTVGVPQEPQQQETKIISINDLM
nr:MAG TPA: hypothetical protein [Caudoviricetes sp.]